MTEISTEPGHTADHLVGPAVRGAIECALWTGMTVDPETREDQDADLRGEMLPAEVEGEIRDDVTDFILANAADCLAYVEARRGQSVAEYDGQTYIDWAGSCIGHDFILTRNGHGAGFWDRGLGDLGDRLTAACEPYGSLSLWSDGQTIIVMH